MRHPFCQLCPEDHERKCRCKHSHDSHNFAGGCVVCWQEFLSFERKRESVCEGYDLRPKSRVNAVA